MGRVRRIPPVKELGLTSEQISGGRMDHQGRVAAWTSFVDEKEYVPDLVWPNSVQKVFPQMRADTQLAGLMAGCILPILRYRWMVDPNGARPELVTELAKDFNLPVKDTEGQPRGRMKKRFVHGKHMKQALTIAIINGHAYFEQVGEIVDNLWRLRKLAPRMPSTISEIKVAPDGGLVSITQGFTMAVGGRWDMDPPEIPVDHLVGYIWDQEGASWIGRSMLRDCYKNWLIKDRLMRVDALNHEHAGGIPFAIGSMGMSQGELAKLNEMMAHFKVGEMRGGAVPFGSEIKVAKGTGSDVVASMRYHDELMARKFLLMLLQLGQTQTGSRALGTTFLDFFSAGQEYIADWYRDVTNEHVIEDWVDWNYGEDEEFVPLLMYEPMEDRALAIADLVQLIESKAIIVDEALEDALRYRYGMPKRQNSRPSFEELEGGSQGVAAAPSGQAVAAGTGSAPSHPPHRPSAEEIEEKLDLVAEEV